MFSIQQRFYLPTKVASMEQFWALVRAPHTAKLVAEARAALAKDDKATYDKKKKQLPLVIFVGTFDESEKEVENKKTGEKRKMKGRWRNQANVNLNGLVVADYDHLDGDVREIWKDVYAKLSDEDKARILLVFVTPSGQGLKVVFMADAKVGNLIDNQLDFSAKLGLKLDESCKDGSRGAFMTTEQDIISISDELFTYENKEFAELYEEQYRNGNSSPSKGSAGVQKCKSADESTDAKRSTLNAKLEYHGVPYAKIVEAWLGGKEVKEGDRHRTSLYLADHLRYITENDAGLIEQILRDTPFVQEIIKERNENVAQTVKSAQGYVFYKNIPKKMQEALRAVGVMDEDTGEEPIEAEIEEDVSNSPLNPYLKYLSQGVIDSIEAVNPGLEMVVLVSICPEIGALATGVKLDVHGQVRGINLISYVAGDFASNKGDIDPVVDAWMSEVKTLDKMYLQQEDDFRAKKRAAKNKKEQPEEPKLPVRFLTLNNTVANLAERLANTEGKHAFSFTPEADTVAQKWRSSMSDFSVMLRQSYDGSRYDREARSAEAVNVHIDHLLWNVTMCGTPDALYRVVSNYTDGFQSRIAIARTPDNTFSPLQEKPRVLTERQKERIQQIAHLLPLMQGEVVLPKLEAKGREWLEGIRLETMKNDDRTKARQRFRVCVTAQRMTCCLMLCKVCETLIQKHGLNGAESRLKQYPNLWKEALLRAQTPQMLEAYDVIADSLLENALHFFRDRIENAFNSRDYAGNINGERMKRGKNDSIFERLDILFSLEQATQQSIAIKGAGVTRNSVQQMLKNWRNQGLVQQTADGKFRKIQSR